MKLREKKPLSVATRALLMGWQLGNDPRRKNGRALISPRWTVYLLVTHPRPCLRRFQPLPMD